ncbi:DEAD-box ATP-dependent RNA helicase 42 [Nematostella vectensis]|uniref:DEAD-box ATP-dependent RNA helicase 42 n=1 Tax=Nematostella vectensis TaxID=45351 RepID=UPI002077714F|nr:DEAD-box ATP-dependent RNA helicase 42 [Nematostella vectensis]
MGKGKDPGKTKRYKEEDVESTGKSNTTCSMLDGKERVMKEKKKEKRKHKKGQRDSSGEQELTHNVNQGEEMKENKRERIEETNRDDGLCDEDVDRGKQKKKSKKTEKRVCQGNENGSIEDVDRKQLKKSKKGENKRCGNEVSNDDDLESKKKENNLKKSRKRRCEDQDSESDDKDKDIRKQEKKLKKKGGKREDKDCGRDDDEIHGQVKNKSKKKRGHDDDGDKEAVVSEEPKRSSSEQEVDIKQNFDENTTKQESGCKPKNKKRKKKKEKKTNETDNESSIKKKSCKDSEDEEHLPSKEKKKKRKKSKDSSEGYIEQSKDIIAETGTSLLKCSEKKILKEAKRQKRKLKDINEAQDELGAEINALQNDMEEKRLQFEQDENSDCASDETGNENATTELKNDELKKGKNEKKRLVKVKEETSVENKGEEPNAGMAALSYLKMWNSNRKQWSFKKVRQVWLLKHMYDPSKVPEDDFDVLLEYLGGLQGFSRQTTIERAEKLVDLETGGDDAADRTRIKRVIQILT